MSGTICLCVEKSFNITLVCVSDGDGGNAELLPSNLGIRLAEIRRRELELSATVLGIANMIFLALMFAFKGPDAIIYFRCRR